MAGLVDLSLFLKKIPGAKQQHEDLAFLAQVAPDKVQRFHHMIAYGVAADAEPAGDILVAQPFISLQLKNQAALRGELRYGFFDQSFDEVEVVGVFLEAGGIAVQGLVYHILHFNFQFLAADAVETAVGGDFKYKSGR